MCRVQDENRSLLDNSEASDIAPNLSPVSPPRNVGEMAVDGDGFEGAPLATEAANV